MLYLLQVTVYSALLYAVYLLALKGRAGHAFSRTYLLLCALLPPFIPFIKVAGVTATMPVAGISHWLPEVTIGGGNHATAADFSYGVIIMAVYAVITLAILLRTIIQYAAFRRFVRSHSYQVIDGARVLLHTGAGPGSFQRYIFLPGGDVQPAIVAHEVAHIRLHHSYDILLLRLLGALYWPDVALIAITRELRLVHEFQADAQAVADKDTYIATLLNDTFGTVRFALSHTFFYHPLKRRIMMLQQSPRSRKRLRAAMLQTGAMATLLLAGIVYLQSCKQQDSPLKPAAESVVSKPLDTAKITVESRQMAEEMVKMMDTAITPKNGALVKKRFANEEKNIGEVAAQLKAFLLMHGNVPDTSANPSGVHTFADKMPAPSYDLGEYLSKNLKYPAAARSKGISGRVIVRFTVDEQGNIVNPNVVRGVDPTLDSEALRVLSAMPAWAPGEQDGKKVSVYFTQPISFQL